MAKIQEASNHCIYFDHLEPVATEVIVWLAELVATEAVCQSSNCHMWFGYICQLIYSVSPYNNSLHVYSSS